MKKMGRPKTNYPKRHTLSFRLDDKDHRAFMDYASKQNLTITQLIIMSVTDYMKRNPSD